MKKVLDLIDSECDMLCSRDSPTSFRCHSAKELEKCTFHMLEEDLKKIAPTTWSVFSHIATPTGKYTRKSTAHYPRECVALAAGILLKERCQPVSTVGYLIGIILWQGNATNKVRIYFALILFTIG